MLLQQASAVTKLHQANHQNAKQPNLLNNAVQRSKNEISLQSVAHMGSSSKSYKGVQKSAFIAAMVVQFPILAQIFRLPICYASRRIQY